MSPRILANRPLDQSIPDPRRTVAYSSSRENLLVADSGRFTNSLSEVNGLVELKINPIAVDAQINKPPAALQRKSSA